MFAATAASSGHRPVTTLTPSKPRLTPGSHDEVRLRVEPAVPPEPALPNVSTSPSGEAGPGRPGSPQRGDSLHIDDGDVSVAPRNPATTRTAPADPGLSLGLLGWLAVLLVVALFAVLAHAANVRVGQQELGEPSLLTDPAYVLAQRHSPQ